MDGVPLKIPPTVSKDVKGHIEVTVPDYLTILQETEYEFSLENWVLTGLQSGFPSQHQPQLSSSSSGLLPSCPPYQMMFSSPQQSHLASCHSSDFWEPNPRQHSHSLNLTVLRTKFTISDSDGEGEIIAQKAQITMSATGHLAGERSAESCQLGLRKTQNAFVNPPACLSSLPHQCRKNLRQCSLFMPETSTQHDFITGSLSSHEDTGTTNIRAPSTRAKTINRLTGINNHNTTDVISLRPDCGEPYVTSAPRGHPLTGSDSSAELLSALSSEERELLGVITAQGYPLHTAIIALQKMGQQTSDQILSYLVACDHLCQLGYDMAQVEEALEMFQNCETKAEEFLHLLSQFNEMGFQQNAIKEVLLIHENHRERALEELMMHVA
nr:ubiquitin-associated protein 1-like [Monopterus albus]